MAGNDVDEICLRHHSSMDECIVDLDYRLREALDESVHVALWIVMPLE